MVIVVMQEPSIDALVKQLISGEKTTGEVAAEFARRDWSVPELTILDMMGGDPAEQAVADPWLPVMLADSSGQLTKEQYLVLAEARERAVRAADQRNGA